MKVHEMLSRLAAGFLVVFLADGVLSMLSEAASLSHLKLPLLAGLQVALAVLVVLWACVMFAALFLTPKLRKRQVLPAVLFTLWASFGSFFPFLLNPQPYALLILSLVQTILGTLLVLAWKQYHQPLSDDRRPGFTWKNLGAGVVISGALLVFFLSSVVITAAHAIDNHTGGYIFLRPSGFYLEERTFRKDDKEVRLVGMMHVALGGFYDSIAVDLKDTKGAVVLLEGVSDEKGLLKKRLSYSKMATLIGITSQEKSSFTSQALEGLRASEQSSTGSVEYRQADLDISALQPETLALVESLSALLASQSIPEVLEHLQKKPSPLNDEEEMKAAMLDLIQTRNRHLMTTLKDALTTSNLVIVPWGALHLQDLQQELEGMGFQQVSSKTRQALRFSPF